MLVICVLIRTFVPGFIIPELDVPDMVLISLVALLAEHYLVGNPKRCYGCVAIFAVVNFGLLPFAACFASAPEAVKLGVIGGAVFTAVTWLFSSMMDRLSSGPAAKFAPILSALGLYLASQCFMGIL
jgi:hypothetical protein